MLLYIEYNDEKKYLKSLLSKITNEAIKNRIENIANWDLNKAYENKIKYEISSALVMIIPAIITLINTINTFTKLIPFLSTLTTIIAGCMTMKQYQKNWLNYRETTEQIKKELSNFAIDKIDSEISLLELIEEINMKESVKWSETNKK